MTWCLEQDSPYSYQSEYTRPHPRQLAHRVATGHPLFPRICTDRLRYHRWYSHIHAWFGSSSVEYRIIKGSMLVKDISENQHASMLTYHVERVQCPNGTENQVMKSSSSTIVPLSDDGGAVCAGCHRSHSCRCPRFCYPSSGCETFCGTNSDCGRAHTPRSPYPRPLVARVSVTYLFRAWFRACGRHRLRQVLKRQ